MLGSFYFEEMVSDRQSADHIAKPTRNCNKFDWLTRSMQRVARQYLSATAVYGCMGTYVVQCETAWTVNEFLQWPLSSALCLSPEGVA